MARLTEEMVIARSKQSDLASIKKLNCWGAELGDVSLLRQMPNVEVLALSLNKISTLVDFAWCERLRELYVRKNDIQDLREIRHLRRLPALTSLWLDENPCTEHPEYRMTVLRNLPNLERLDNLPVHPDEVTEAHRRGAHIPDSDEEDECQEPNDEQEQEWREPSPELEPPTSTRDDESDRQTEYYDRRENATGGRENTSDRRESFTSGRESFTGSRENATGNRESYPDRRENVAEYREPADYRERVERREPEWTERRESRENENDWREPPDRRDPEWSERRDCDRRELTQPCRAASAMTRSYYWPPPCQRADPPLRHSASAHSVHQGTAGTGQGTGQGTGGTDQGTAGTAGQGDRERERGEGEGRGEARDRLMDSSRCGCMCIRADRRGRRPTARTSNLLSAALCLVKELDYPSLEVVELAVRCRMDELAGSQ